MAELNYDDVRRAAQEAMRDIRTVVYGLQSSHDDLRRAVQQSNQYQLSDIVSKLQNVQQQINALHSAIRSHNTQPSSIHYNIQQSVGDLHRRLNRLEQFVELCYRYFETMQRENAEDQAFKST